MAKARTIRPVDILQGKLKKDDDVYYRYRNGQQFAVRLDNPRKLFSQKEKTLHAGFGQLSKIASQFAKNETKAAPYMEGFNAQKNQEGGQKSLYQYILTQLLREAKSDRAAKIAELSNNQ